MKKTILILLFFLPLLFVKAQSFETSVGLVYGSANSSIEEGAGVVFAASYKPMKFFRLRTTGEVYFSGFKGILPYVPVDNISFFSIEESIIYYPFLYDIEPFIGAGFGYYNISHNTPGMGSSYQGSFTFNDFEEKKFAPHFLAGIKFSATTPLSLQINFKYIILNQDLSARWRDVIISENINLNTFTADLSLLYNFNF